MKDSVKITVIATGFKDGDGIRRRRTEMLSQFTGSQAPKVEDDFPEPEAEPEPPAPPMVMEQATPEPQAAANEVISLDAMRGAMIANVNYEPEDLDVPAFLRKRSDVI